MAAKDPSHGSSVSHCCWRNLNPHKADPHRAHSKNAWRATSAPLRRPFLFTFLFLSGFEESPKGIVNRTRPCGYRDRCLPKTAVPYHIRLHTFGLGKCSVAKLNTHWSHIQVLHLAPPSATIPPKTPQASFERNKINPSH